MSEQNQWDDLEVDRDGYVGRITLARPEAMNTFSTQLARELDEALQEFDADVRVRAIVIDGEGDAFSAGIDLSEHHSHETKSDYVGWVERMEDPFLTVTEMRTPVIAAVHGHAAANGLGMVAASDLAVAAEGTKFGATAPKVGLFCMGPAVPLMETLTRKRTLELLLTGDLIDASTAADWGLVNRVTSPDEHLQEAMELADTITSKSPVAVQDGKEAFYEMAGMEYGEALKYSNERFADLCLSGDAEKGIDAFLDGEVLSADEWPES